MAGTTKRDRSSQRRDAVVFPTEATLSATQAADVLGVSRMTVVRLIDRGELRADTSSVHPRIPASEVKRYQTGFRLRQREAMAELAEDFTASMPADRVIETR